VAAARYLPAADGMLVLATGSVSLVLATQATPAGFRHFDTSAYVLTCLANAALLSRHRAPFTVLLFYCIVWFGYVAEGYWPVVNSPGALVALYTVAVFRSWRITVAAMLGVSAVWAYAGRAVIVVAVLQGVVWAGLTGRFGYSAGRLAVRNKQLARFVLWLEREPDERARRAVVSERLRMAREMHDLVAHHMSVISVQAGLARYVLGSDREAAHAAITTVMDTSGAALGELRQLLSVLRPGPDDMGEATGESVPPVPGIDQLGALAERVRAAGVPVRVELSGDFLAFSADAELCVYRVIQESLTNVLRHAAPASATVTVHGDRDGLTARVTDNGRPKPGADQEPLGHGLVGMRERAKLHGGTLSAGPRPEGGYEVTLVLPAPSSTC
jgi:signal transduction histidine kinase